MTGTYLQRFSPIPGLRVSSPVSRIPCPFCCPLPSAHRLLPTAFRILSPGS